MNTIDQTHTSQSRYSYKETPSSSISFKSEHDTTQHSLTNTWAADYLTHSTRKPNNMLMILSILPSHCWRSHSSITMEGKKEKKKKWKKKLLNNFKSNTKLSLGSQMRSYAVPAHLQLPQKLPQPKAKETEATFPKQWTKHLHKDTFGDWNCF